jgi:ParB family protein of integrating conjugative element (PFGI_1 class)
MNEKISVQEMAAKLLGEGNDRFDRKGPMVDALSDPVADTIIEVTLDQLHPYDHNPRITKNPLYEEIKASIRARGLDAPPAVTRRPGEPHYIIRNGGNTRLGVLQELWGETRDEQFFRIKCLFRPWSARGEIIALSGHLAENELHGRLTFIERALGVEKLHTLYEQETGGALSQSELARQLKADGYPVQQSIISRMQGTIQYLLPAMPDVLYGGLGRPQIEKLLVIRQSATQLWRAHAGATEEDFAGLFQDVLSAFDVALEHFSVADVQDALVERMAEELGTSYDTLAAGILYFDKHAQDNSVSAGGAVPSFLLEQTPQLPPEPDVPKTKPLPTRALAAPPLPVAAHDCNNGEAQTAWVPTASPDQSSSRLVSINDLIVKNTDEASGLDTPESLRRHIAQTAREIAHEADLDKHVAAHDRGIGFICTQNADTHAGAVKRGVLALLHVLSAPYVPGSAAGIDVTHLAHDLGPALLGSPARSGEALVRLSDAGIACLFRLLQWGRYLVEVERNAADSNGIT